jgi:hypothetical protein
MNFSKFVFSLYKRTFICKRVPLLFVVGITTSVPCLNTFQPSPSTKRETSVDERAIPAEEFTNSIGINLHINYFDRLYGNFNLVKQKLNKLPIRHVRDGAQLINRDYDSLMYGRWIELQSMGIKFNAVLDPRGSIKQPSLVNLQALIEHSHGAIESIEGPNELDISNLKGWPGVLAAYQSQIFQSVRSQKQISDIHVVAPSMAFIRNGRTIAELRTDADFGNLHSYPAGQMPSNIFPEQLDIAHEIFGSLPIVMTETGYHNALADKNDQPGVSELAAAKYVPRIFLENFLHGISRTYLYELFDEAPNPDLNDNQLHWGLIRNDGTEKPAYTALANLLSILDEQHHSYPTQHLTLSISGDSDNIHHLVIEKSNGNFYLILWQEVSSYDTKSERDINIVPRNLVLNLPNGPYIALFYDPLLSSSAKLTYKAIKRIQLQVPDYPVIIELSKPPQRINYSRHAH